MFQKTRSSSAVGQKVKMRYDPTSMRITDYQSSDAIETEKPMPIEELKKEIAASHPSSSEDRTIRTKLEKMMVQAKKSDL